MVTAFLIIIGLNVLGAILGVIGIWIIENENKRYGVKK